MNNYELQSECGIDGMKLLEEKSVCTTHHEMCVWFMYPYGLTVYYGLQWAGLHLACLNFHLIYWYFSQDFYSSTSVTCMEHAICEVPEELRRLISKC